MSSSAAIKEEVKKWSKENVLKVCCAFKVGYVNSGRLKERMPIAHTEDLLNISVSQDGEGAVERQQCIL